MQLAEDPLPKNKNAHRATRPGVAIGLATTVLTAALAGGHWLGESNPSKLSAAAPLSPSPEAAPPITPADQAAAKLAVDDTQNRLLNVKWLHFEGGMAHIRLNNEDYLIDDPLVARENGIDLIGWFNRPAENVPTAGVEFIARNQVLDWNGDHMSQGINYHQTYSVAFPATIGTPKNTPYDLTNPVNSHHKPLIGVGQIGFLFDAGNLQLPPSQPVTSGSQDV